MKLIEQIEAEYKVAYKAHNQPKVNVLRLVKSALKNEEIALRKHVLEEAEEIAVLTREAKRRREAIAMYQKAGHIERAAGEQAELIELEKFLPAQMTDESLQTLVQATAAEIKAGPADFGKVMGAVMKKVQGQADGNRVSAAVKKVLKPQT